MVSGSRILWIIGGVFSLKNVFHLNDALNASQSLISQKEKQIIKLFSLKKDLKIFHHDIEGISEENLNKIFKNEDACFFLKKWSQKLNLSKNTDLMKKFLKFLAIADEDILNGFFDLWKKRTENNIYPFNVELFNVFIKNYEIIYKKPLINLIRTFNQYLKVYNREQLESVELLLRLPKEHMYTMIFNIFKNIIEKDYISEDFSCEMFRYIFIRIFQKNTLKIIETTGAELKDIDNILRMIQKNRSKIIFCDLKDIPYIVKQEMINKVNYGSYGHNKF
jgi:hypothetical protein